MEEVGRIWRRKFGFWGQGVRLTWLVHTLLKVTKAKV